MKESKSDSIRQQQYELLLKFSKRYRPDWYLKMVGENDLDEFHEVLKNLSFHKKIYQVKDSNFFNRTSIYIQIIVDDKDKNELFKFKVFKCKKNFFTNSCKKLKIFILSFNDDRKLFEQ